MVDRQIVRSLAIRNYKIEFPFKKNKFVDLEECYKNLKKKGVLCKLDLESYKALQVHFKEIAFNFFSSGKGTLYFSSELLSVEEANEILNRFYYVFVRPFVVNLEES